MPQSGTHQIVISEDARTPQQLCSAIAHEMYHRVTAGRKGLAEEMWIQEIMATLTSYWFLYQQGFGEYAEGIRKVWLASEGKTDMALLRRTRRNERHWLLTGERAETEAFVESIFRLSFALRRALDKEDIGRIVRFETLEEWVASLPPGDQYAVCRLLELPADGRLIPDDQKSFVRLFQGLQHKGDKEVLVAEFEQIVHLQPANSAAAFYLGYAYHVAKQHEAALNAYAQAKDLGYSDKWLVYNIGSVYWQMKNYSPAAEWFQKATEQEPEWAQPYYFLGCSLNNLGVIGAARQAWERVLTLDDEHYTKLAQKALEESPLPDDAAPE